MENPVIAIFGSGAMACLFAGLLSLSGSEVYLAGEWAEGIKSIREKGIILKIGEQTLHQHVKTILSGEPFPPCHYALVLVKSWQTARTAAQIETCLLPDGIALTLQNGLGNDLVLEQKLGRSRVAVGVTTLGATLTSPGQVTGFTHGTIVIHELDGIAGLLSALEKAQFNISTASSIENMLWGKLVINAAINPLTALLGVNNGKLLELPDALLVMEHIAIEVQNVSAALSISLPHPDSIQQIKTAARATAQNYSSMYQDMQRGAPTEIEQINGAIVRLGLHNAVPTPYNQCMFSLVKSRAILNTSR